MSSPLDRPPDDPDSEARRRIASRLRKVARNLGTRPPPPIKRQSPPLALFPLRLEYRVIDAGRRFVRARTSAEGLRAAPRADHGGSPSPDRAAGRSVRHLDFIEERLAEREVWWRWFPDDPFAAQGVPPPTELESAALGRFRNAIGPSSWWDVTRPDVCAAFAALAQEVGAWRALHLLRATQSSSVNWEQRVGKLVALPKQVALYAVAGDDVTELGVGSPIPADLRLSAAELRPGGWLVDFAAAVEQGMGLRLRAPDKVTAAFGADWVIAIGLGEGDATSELEDFLGDACANGNLELMAPGTPTNRVAGRHPAFEREPADPVAFLQRATIAERSGSTTIPKDGGSLSVALGIDARLLERVPGGQAEAREAARAMSRALLPGLTDGLFRTVPDLGRQRHAVLEFLCEHAASRGPFPPVRVGHTPYGVLPVTDLDQVRAPGRSTEGEREAFAFCSRVASASIGWLESERSDLPIVRPDDPQAHEKLDEALRVQSVSQRVVVRNLPGSKALVMRCPLVRAAGFDPAIYLRQLADLPLEQLPNPDEGDVQTPLLYRLVRFSREVLERPAVREPGRLPTRIRRPTSRGPARSSALSADLAEALHLLAEVAPSDLERLLLEVLDFLDHRADAWFTALATSRLSALRIAQPRGLRAGWYGFLARLRDQTDHPTHGYLQAPSLAQATTAGILRAASLRHPGSAFEIDLSSSRARRAVRLLDELRQGAELGRALGNLVARRLHDAGQDFVLHLLRAAYPLSGNAPQGAVPPLDGLAFHDDASLAALQGTSLFTGLTQPERARTLDRAAGAREYLTEAFDGLADLVMAEAAHQLTLGNAGAANAWMQVLSGDPPPHELVFLRTPRDAQGSTRRWAFVREPPASAGSNPRTLIEPSVAALASELLVGFPTCGVVVVVTAPGGSDVRRTFLLRDLGMEPVDVAIGGENEVRLRARFALWRRWRADSGLQTDLGPPPAGDVVAQLSSTYNFRIDATVSANGAPALEELLRLSRPLVDLLAASRPLRPQDLVVVAPIELSSTDLAALIREACLGLASRCTALETRLIALESALGVAATAVVTAADQVLVERAESGADSPAAVQAVDRLEQRLNELETALDTASFFAVPDALHPFGAEAVIANPTAVNALATRLGSQLTRRRQGLAEARDRVQSLSGENVASWQACLDQLCRALRDAGDGDGLAVWPQLTREAALTPIIDSSSDVPSAAIGLERLRPQLAVASKLAERLGNLRAHVAHPPAPVAAPPAPPPTRSDLDRPPSIHEAVFVGTAGVFSSSRLCGVVIDEWSDERPSRRQVTGLAVHYDAPQSESPKVVLLGVPASDDQPDWNVERAVELVRETIRWTIVRSLPASRSSLSRVVAPLFSVVTPVAGRPTRRRVPTGLKRWLVDVATGPGLVAERVSGVPEADLIVHGQRRTKGT